MEPVGLYIHIPFCVSKCPYCDFYSLCDPDRADPYVALLERQIRGLAGAYTADTLYFGGGTPSLLGGARIARLITAARETLLTADAEITMEANPGDGLPEVFEAFAKAGGNRVSIGLQAADDRLLRTLGRRHTVAQANEAVGLAKRAGIGNVSLDLMLALPGQTAEDVRRSVAFCAALEVTHLSAYLLKIEPGTPFAKRERELALPDEDAAAELYLLACGEAERAGFRQYEISNFARPGFESRHNLKYWDMRPYLGLGPAAHGFTSGKRWYYPRDLAGYLKGEPPLAEEGTPPAGSAEEYALLRLRLAEGLTAAGFSDRFGEPLPSSWRTRAAALPHELVVSDECGIRLTAKGFLLSNPLTERILWD